MRTTVAERGLQRAESGRGRQPLDRRHRGAVELHGQQQAAARALTVDENGAGPAHAVLAADVGAGEGEVVAQEVGERTAHVDGPVDGLPVHRQPDPHLHGAP